MIDRATVLRFLTSVGAGLVVISASLAVEPIYTCRVLEEITPLRSGWETVLRINNAGDVVGTVAGGDDGSLEFGFVLRAGASAITIIDPTAAGGSRVTAINQNGLVVGVTRRSSGGSDNVAFAFHHNTLTDLTDLGAGLPWGVNDEGVMVGQIGDVGFRFANGISTPLGTLGGTVTVARAINNVGDIVGASTLAKGDRRAFLLRNDVMMDLGTRAGFESEALDINENGVAVGWTTEYVGRKHPAIFRNGIVEEFSWTPFDTGVAYGVNERDEVVGTFMLSGLPHPFVHIAGGRYDLMPWIARCGFAYAAATGINDHGAIVGYGVIGTEWKAFVLTRVPYAPAPETTYSFTQRVGVQDGVGLFFTANDVTSDKEGNVFVADEFSYTVRKISPAGQVTTVAGLAAVRGFKDGNGYHARFGGPRGIAVDSQGFLYVADSGYDEWGDSMAAIRKVAPDGTVTTLAGDGKNGFADGQGIAARFGGVSDIVIGGFGDLYVLDGGNSVIRKITPDGLVSTFAGRPGESGSVDGVGADAQFLNPRRMTIDSGGNLFVTEGPNRIRRITPAAEVTTIELTADPALLPPQLWLNDGGIAVNAGGQLFVADDFYRRIHQVSPSGVVQGFAGGPESYARARSYDGVGDDAGFAQPYGMVFDRTGNLIVADLTCVRSIAPDRAVTTIAGTKIGQGSADGGPAGLALVSPTGIAKDRVGNLLIVDRAQHAVFKLTPVGDLSVFAGRPGVPGAQDGVGGEARLRDPGAAVLSTAGDLYVTEGPDIRKIAPDGTVTTFVGLPATPGHADGIGTAARFFGISGIAYDGAETLYVCDQSRFVIRRITLSGEVVTIAGMPGDAGLVDGAGTAARFQKPISLTIGHGGDLFVSDTGYIRRVTPAGVVTTVAGTGPIVEDLPVYRDGPGWAVRFSGPGCLTTDRDGNVLIADAPRIRLLDAAMNVFTIVGPPVEQIWFPTSDITDGIGATANFGVDGNLCMLVDDSGLLYVGDGQLHSIRIGQAATRDYPTITQQPQNRMVAADDGSGSFSVTVTSGTPVTYQWQRQPWGTTAWTDPNLATVWHDVVDDEYFSGASTGTLTITAAPMDFIGDRYRCLVTNAAGTNVTTNAILQVVEPQLDIQKQPLDATTTDGFTTTFFATLRTNPSGITRHWQGSSDGGATWFDLLEGEDFWNVDTLEVGVRARLSMNGWLFRCRATNGWVPEIITGTARLSVVPSSDYSFSTLAWMWEYDSVLGYDVWNWGPKDVAVSKDGKIYVAHLLGWIDRIDGTGDAQVILGSKDDPLPAGPPRQPVVFVGGQTGAADGVGASAQFLGIRGITIDDTGNLFVTDDVRIRKITPAGVVTTVAGATGEHGVADGSGVEARFTLPSGIVAASDGSLFVADAWTIRRVSPDGIVSTIAGIPEQIGFRDGPAATALFAYPRDIDIDGQGNLYVCDEGNSVVRKVTPGGMVSTLAGLPGDSGNIIISGRAQQAQSDGLGSGARLSGLTGLAVDQAGNVFVLDNGFDLVRMINPDGFVTTVAGVFNHWKGGNVLGWYSDGTGPHVRFCTPWGLDVDQAGNLYVVSYSDGAVRIGRPVGVRFMLQPVRTETRSFDAASFTSAAAGPGALSYRWQRQAPESGEWRDVVEGANHRGARTQVLEVVDARVAMNGTRYRCIAGNGVNADAISAMAELSVAPAQAEISLSNLRQLYDGTPRQVGINVSPAGVAFEVRYDGADTVPTSVGTYAVTAVVNDPEYTGTATGTLEIVPAVTAASATSVTDAAGRNARFVVTANAGTHPAIRWQFRARGEDLWQDIAGADGSELALSATQRFHSGTYRAVVTANGVSTTSGEFTLEVASGITSPDARLLNLSTRAQVQTGTNVLIPGFVITGAQNKKLLIRAVGPTLGEAPFNVPGVLPDPRIVLKRFNPVTQLYDVDVASNDDWSTNANFAELKQTAADVFAFGIPDASKDAALLLDLAPGQYTVIADDAANASGIAIVELYDADASGAGSRLINISNRGFVGTGVNVMIPGFVVSHEGPKTFLIRAVGPTLAHAPYNVPGTMADPELVVYRSNQPAPGDSQILSQNNWGENPDASYTAQIAQEVFAFPLDADSADAAFVVTLPPGSYTVHGRSADGVDTGVVLVEIYVVE